MNIFDINVQLNQNQTALIQIHLFLVYSTGQYIYSFLNTDDGDNYIHNIMNLNINSTAKAQGGKEC